MSEFNTFTGKTVDDAIQEACKFFTTEREKLEVEILSGGSTGIFGLVGKKKAQIRARRRQDPARALKEAQSARASADKAAKEAQADAAASAAAPTPATDAPAQEQPAPPVAPAPPEAAEAKPAKPAAPRRGREPREPREPRQPKEAREPREPRQPRQPKEARDPKEAKEPTEQREAKDPREPKPQREPKPRQQGGGQRQPRAESKPRREREADDTSENGGREAFPEDAAPMVEDKSPASQELLDLARGIMTRLLTPILDQEAPMEVEGTASRVNVIIQDEQHSGLLIGREGQTLAALQYLANRILARQWQSPVRLQINTGDYREKQDDNLRKMALYLADKAKNLGRPQSTKPLSSYHRRVIHLALQTDDTIQTRSKGDGPMKRVIILPKRPKNGAAAPQAPLQAQPQPQEQDRPQ